LPPLSMSELKQELIFNDPSYSILVVRKWQGTPPQSYAWILALGRSKNENLLRLSKVTLFGGDRPRWGEIIPRDVREVDLIE
jgi:hypothetical protein